MFKVLNMLEYYDILIINIVLSQFSLGTVNDVTTLLITIWHGPKNFPWTS